MPEFLFKVLTMGYRMSGIWKTPVGQTNVDVQRASGKE